MKRNLVFWMFVMSVAALGLNCDKGPAEAPEGSGSESGSTLDGSGTQEEATNETEETPTEEPTTQAEDPTASEVTLPVLPQGWTYLDRDALEATHQGQFDRAEAARSEFTGTLMRSLMGTVEAEGFVGAIDVCQGEAPAVAVSVGETHSVRIGRTSRGLRNPTNTPPTWAAPFVTSEIDTAQVVAGPEGMVGVATPLITGAPCLNCHGSQDEMAEGVAEQLSVLYPEDSATNFAVGSVRGWLWVEAGATQP